MTEEQQLRQSLAGTGHQIEGKHPILARAVAGPFLCGNCRHWLDREYCDQSDLLDDVQAGEVTDLTIVYRRGQPLLKTLAEGDCCDYFKKARKA